MLILREVLTVNAFDGVFVPVLLRQIVYESSIPRKSYSGSHMWPSMEDVKIIY